MTVESTPDKTIQAPQSGALAQDTSSDLNMPVMNSARQSRKFSRYARKALSEILEQQEGDSKMYINKLFVNMKQESGNELPASADTACLRAPDTITENIETHGKTDAMNPDTMPDQKPDRNNKTPKDDIFNIIRDSDCSLRLLNLIILHSDDLPVKTVREYMKAPKQYRKAFLRLPRFGTVLVNELDQIIRKCKFSPDIGEIITDRQRKMKRNAEFQRATRAAEAFFAGIFYPDELLEWSPSTRLENQLKVDQVNHRKSFADFLKTFDKTCSRLLLQSGCGVTTIREIEEIVLRLIEARLSTYGADSKIALDLIRLLRSKINTGTSFAGVIELENIKFEKIEAFEMNLVKKMKMTEIIMKAISSLDKRNGKILQLRYGIDSDAQETLLEIGNRYGLTRERIRQIERKARRKLGTNRMITTLVAALKQEETLKKLFNNRKIISGKELSLEKKLLTADECLAIDMAYGNLKSFLNTEAIRIKAGWIRKHDLTLINIGKEDLSGTLIQRIMSAIQKQNFPIRLSRIQSLLPDYPLPEIRNTLAKYFGATFEGDLVETCPELPVSIQCILILREAGHAMHCNEIKARILELFANNKTNQHIGTALMRMEESLIVGKGTYDLYENMSLSESDLEKIRVRAFHHLKNVDGFIKSEDLFSDLFQEDSEQFGTEFGYHMLFGILHSDGRFRTRRRMKVSLAVASDDGSNS